MKTFTLDWQVLPDTWNPTPDTYCELVLIAGSFEWPETIEA